MDNRKIDLWLEDKFELAMQLAMGVHKAIGYRVHENNMVLYWAKSDKMTPFPYEMSITDATNFVSGWLQKTEPNHPRPDHDGDNEKGFRIFNEDWGHVFGEWQAFIAITPIWAMYGK